MNWRENIITNTPEIRNLLNETRIVAVLGIKTEAQPGQPAFYVPSYLQSAVDTKVKNLRDWGIPLGRRFRALKLWCLIREQGVERLQTRLRRDLANAQWFAEQVRSTPDWCVLAPVPLQTICVRHEPSGLAGEVLDKHTLEWVERVNNSGGAYLTPATLDGRWMVRVSIGALLTERQHVEALWELMRYEAESND